MTTRVVIADDQGMIRSGLRSLLSGQADIDVVGEAGDGEAAVELARSAAADVVLMDIRMPVLDGLAATRRLTTGSPGARVLVLTTFDLDEYVFEPSAPAPAASCSRTRRPRTCSRRSAPSARGTPCSTAR
jgi:DNA-binding NarL/FixJ family response regulator